MVKKNVKQDSAKQLHIFWGANNYMIINVYLFSSMGGGGGGGVESIDWWTSHQMRYNEKQNGLFCL